MPSKSICSRAHTKLPSALNGRAMESRPAWALIRGNGRSGPTGVRIVDRCRRRCGYPPGKARTAPDRPRYGSGARARRKSLAAWRHPASPEPAAPARTGPPCPNFCGPGIDVQRDHRLVEHQPVDDDLLLQQRQQAHADIEALGGDERRATHARRRRQRHVARAQADGGKEGKRRLPRW